MRGTGKGESQIQASRVGRKESQERKVQRADVTTDADQAYGPGWCRAMGRSHTPREQRRALWSH